MDRSNFGRYRKIMWTLFQAREKVLNKYGCISSRLESLDRGTIDGRKGVLGHCERNYKGLLNEDGGLGSRRRSLLENTSSRKSSRSVPGVKTTGADTHWGGEHVLDVDNWVEDHLSYTVLTTLQGKLSSTEDKPQDRWKVRVWKVRNSDSLRATRQHSSGPPFLYCRDRLSVPPGLWTVVGHSLRLV